MILIMTSIINQYSVIGIILLQMNYFIQLQFNIS